MAAGEPLSLQAVDHSKTCRPCSDELERLRSVLATVEGELDSALALGDTRDFTARVRRSVLQTETSRGGNRRPLLLAAAALAALVGTWSSWKMFSPPPPRVETATVQYEPPVEPERVVAAPEPPPSLPPARKVPPTLQIVVPPGQAEMILQLQRELARGRVSLAPSQPEPAALHIERLQITRLRIDPLEIESRR